LCIQASAVVRKTSVSPVIYGAKYLPLSHVVCHKPAISVGPNVGPGQMGRLTDKAVKSAGVGRHGDGDGLNLSVSKSGRRKWVLRFQLNGARRDMGLGSYPAVSLSTARIAAADARKLLSQNLDPLDARITSRKGEKPIPTFQDIARVVIEEAQNKSTNAKVRYQWERHLGVAYCAPLLARPVHEITTLEVAAVLKPVWHAKPEVARKLYPAIRRVFEYARIRLRDDHGILVPDNPARWDDLKAMGFDPPTRLSRGNHPSLPHLRLPFFIAELRTRDAIAARALEFLILTNVRTDAVLKARWDELDLDGALWSVPLAKLKDRKYRKEAFRVPLSPRAVEMAGEMEIGKVSEYIFPGQPSKKFAGQAPKKPLSNMALLTLIKRMNSVATEKWVDIADGRQITAHGFRATFRTWAEESTGFPHAVIEEAMGHQVGNEVERAYRRTDVLEKRRELMVSWANFCEPVRSTVVSPQQSQHESNSGP
jgi:integrase